MDRILFGDNQFFAVNHISDEKSRAQAIKFKDDKVILKTLEYAKLSGVNTFMCTTHDRIANICDAIRSESLKFSGFNVYPCMPYAHKYANSVTDLGITGTVKEYLPGNLMSSLIKGGVGIIAKDYFALMEIFIDAEMKMFKGVSTPVIFLQNIVTDMLIGLGMNKVLAHFHYYIRKKYNSEAGFITMNMPKLLDILEAEGICNPIVCFSMNKAGFRMSGGREANERELSRREFRAVAMQVLAGGAVPPREAIEYVCKFNNIRSILFGASSKDNIQQTVSLINEYDAFNRILLKPNFV